MFNWIKQKFWKHELWVVDLAMRYSFFALFFRYICCLGYSILCACSAYLLFFLASIIAYGFGLGEYLPGWLNLIWGLLVFAGFIIMAWREQRQTEREKQFRLSKDHTVSMNENDMGTGD